MHGGGGGGGGTSHISGMAEATVVKFCMQVERSSQGYFTFQKII